MSQAPLTGPMVTYVGDMLAIVMHPAFRLGFLDARSGRDLDHDDIERRIAAETPAGALARLGYSGGLVGERAVEIAQFRYEEGREVFVRFKPKVRAWGHPDYPPVAICDLCRQLSSERGGRMEGIEPNPPRST